MTSLARFEATVHAYSKLVASMADSLRREMTRRPLSDSAQQAELIATMKSAAELDALLREKRIEFGRRAGNALFEAFAAQNRSPDALAAGSLRPLPVRLMRRAVLQKEQPPIAARLGRVGFSADGRRALAWLQMVNLGTPTRVTLSLLERNAAGKWEIVDSTF
jgi:hypothetical protein